MAYDRTAPRPHLRKYPDPIDHKLFMDCMRARAQAWYLGEEWLLTDEEYIQQWRQDDRYLHKGRHNDQLCMTRLNYELPWSMDNIQIITRAEHYRFCSTHKIGKFKQRKPRRTADAEQRL
jgi:hypothetical protein